MQHIINSKYARLLIPSQPHTQKFFFQSHTQYDPTMQHSHCETVYAVPMTVLWMFTSSEFFQFSQLSNKLVSLKNANEEQNTQFGLGLKLKIELKINFNQAQN